MLCCTALCSWYLELMLILMAFGLHPPMGTLAHVVVLLAQERLVLHKDESSYDCPSPNQPCYKWSSLGALLNKSFPAFFDPNSQDFVGPPSHLHWVPTQMIQAFVWYALCLLLLSATRFSRLFQLPQSRSSLWWHQWFGSLWWTWYQTKCYCSRNQSNTFLLQQKVDQKDRMLWNQWDTSWCQHALQLAHGKSNTMIQPPVASCRMNTMSGWGSSWRFRFTWKRSESSDLKALSPHRMPFVVNNKKSIWSQRLANKMWLWKLFIPLLQRKFLICCIISKACKLAKSLSIFST